MGGGGGSTSLWNYYSSVYLPTLHQRLGFFIWDNYSLFEGRPGVFLASFFALFIVSFSFLPVTLSIGKRRSVPPPLRYAFLFLGVSLIWYLLIPRVEGFNYSYMRYSVFCLLAVVIVGSIVDPGIGQRTRTIYLCIVVVVHLLLWSNYFCEFDKDNRMFTGDIFPDSKTARLAGIITDYKYRGQPVYIHFPNYHIIWNRGIATPKFVDIAEVWRIGRKADHAILPPYNEWIGRTADSDPRYLDLDHLIVRGEMDQSLAVYKNRFAVVKSAGPWRLLENRRVGSGDAEKPESQKNR
jgi:hypothetical protein